MKIILGKKLYDYDEVATIFGVHKTTIARYVKERGLQTKTILRRKYISEEQIKKLLPGD